MIPNLNSKIFLDGGDPKETLEAKKLLGSLAGQTTNPTLIAKNPEALERLAKGGIFSKEEVLSFYKKVVEEIAAIVDWSVSIEPYVDHTTSVPEILKQAREMNTWTPKAWIKFPTTKNGLTAASILVKEGIRANMTLCFSQEQAAAVYSATKGSQDIFLSPFVGRLDDRGEDGMRLIVNILKMFRGGDGHVLTLTASVRTLDHFLYALRLGSPVITVPYKVLKAWHDGGCIIPDENYQYNTSLKPIPYKEIPLDKDWQTYNIKHDLTDIGIDKFSSDWNNLVK